MAVPEYGHGLSVLYSLLYTAQRKTQATRPFVFTKTIDVAVSSLSKSINITLVHCPVDVITPRTIAMTMSVCASISLKLHVRSSPNFCA